MALIPRSRPDWEPYRPTGVDRRRWWWSSRFRVRKPRLHRPPASLDELLDELADRWERGEAPRAEEYVARLAVDDPEGVVALAYKEFCLAEEAGLEPDRADLLDRFPDHRERLGRLFELHAAVDIDHLCLWVGDSGPSARGALADRALPQSGDAIGPYLLLRELGRGSFARVFLATQADLEDRYVVVKVSTRISPEPRLLARARHAQIVEVLRRTEADDGALHLLCMPFLGGATLDAVLAERRRWGPPPRAGSELLADLDHVAAPEYPEAGRAGPSREVLASLSYPRAVAWIIARLAEALDHASTRDVTHGDLKPSNILLAADGRPLLFDFNLSVDWRQFDGPAGLPPAELGGTLAYMAPERLRVLADPDHAPAPQLSDRHTADIYALGLILAEALTGRSPEVPGHSRLTPRALAAELADDREDVGGTLRALRAAVPPELAPIVLRCLDPDPARRYRRATELAEDLDLYRDDRPPRHADPIARRHRAYRWARRHRLAIAAGVVLLAGAVPAAVLADARSRHEAAEAKLAQLWDGAMPGVYRARRDGQRIPISEVDPARAALDALARYGLTEPGDWRSRSDVSALADSDRLDLEAWLMEQAWRYAEAVITRPNNDWASARARALAILERVGGHAPPAPLLTQADRLRELLGRDAVPRRVQPAAPWLEQYLRGVEDEAERPAEALAHYRTSLEARPEAYWSHYRLTAAACAPDVRAFALAERHMRRCLAIRPTNPLLHLFHAGLLYHLDQPGAAFDGANRALSLDPELHEAYRTRFWARLKIHQDEAVPVARLPGDADAVAVDYRRLRELSDERDPARLWPLLLDARAAFGPRVAFGDDPEDGGYAQLQAAAAFDLDARWALGWQLQEDQKYPESLARFESILARAPDHIEARYAQARLLDALDRGDRQALEALVADPQFESFVNRYPYAIRAFHVLASQALHADDVEAAVAHARRGLSFAERRKAMLGESRYALARSLAAGAQPDLALIDEAANQLRLAGELLPRVITESFEADPFFARHREEIRAKLQQDDPPRR